MAKFMYIDKTRVVSQLESLGLAIGYFINICLNITKTKTKGPIKRN